MKNSTNAEIENPFTMRGLIIVIIQDLNDIRRKIELIENYIIFQNNGNKFIFKEWNEKENFLMINNSNSSLHLPLELDERLKEKNIIIEFYYHISTQHIKISLNHKYQPINAIFKIDIDDWSKNAEKITKILKPKGVNKDDIELLFTTLDNHWKKIFDVIHNNNNNNNNNNNLASIVVSDLTDLSD